MCNFTRSRIVVYKIIFIIVLNYINFRLPTLSWNVLEHICSYAYHYVVNSCFPLVVVTWIFSLLAIVCRCNVIAMAPAIVCVVRVPMLGLLRFVILDVVVAKSVLLLLFLRNLICSYAVKIVCEL